MLCTLVASCEKKGVNPLEYLTDVLRRVQTHPAHRIEELLPHRWKPPKGAWIAPAGSMRTGYTIRDDLA